VNGTLLPEPALLIETCIECEQDVQHCHGTAFVHCDGMADCAEDPGCRLAAEQHVFVVSCAEVDCGCRVAPEVNWPGAKAAAS
jgi:hypothetical protein